MGEQAADTEVPSEEEEWHPLKYSIPPKDPRSKLFNKYNPFSRTFFCWVDPLFWYGSRHTLQHKDLYACPAEAGSKYLVGKFNRYWNQELLRHKNGGTARLWLVMLKCFWWRLIIHALLILVQLPMVLYVSLFLGDLTEYFDIDSPTLAEKRRAYLNALGLSLITVFLVILIGIGAFMGYKLGMLFRIICTTAMYKKILCLSQSTVCQLTTGHIVNLVSNDVHRFDLAFVFYPFLLLGPLFVLLISYFLYIEIGPSTFLAVAMVIGQIPVQIVLSRIFIKLRLKAAKVTDQRVKVMNEVISGIRVIKMYGWELAFHKMVTAIRKKEIGITMKSSVIRAINLSTYTFTLPLMMFVVFSVYGALEGVEAVTLRKVFITLSLLTVAKNLSNFVFVAATTHVSEGLVAMKRIKQFLLHEDMENLRCDTDGDQHISVSKKSMYLDSSGLDSNEVKRSQYPFINVSSLCCSWTSNDCLTLKDVSFNVNQEHPLIAVVGAVGSGKSTLLQCLLGELPLVRGEINMKGSVAYAGQEPWIFSASVRENILFGKPYQMDWYNTVVDACALDKDIDTLPEGDHTLVGERGVTLSGGQKARVSLARAVYRKADIYLLDDPLSAVDAAVSRHIFDKCIRGLLSENSVVVLVTHQLQYVEQCDLVLGLKEGMVTSYGDPFEVLEAENLDLFNKKEEEEPQNQFLDSENLGNNIVDLSKVDLQTEEGTEEIVETEASFLGVMATDAVSINSFTAHEPSISQRQSSEDKRTGNASEDRSEGTISYKTYHNYFKAGGGSVFTFGMFFIFIMAEVSVVVADWWVADWADSSSNAINDSSVFNLHERVGIYGALTGIAVILCVSRTVLFYTVLLRATMVSHNKMFISVLRSPILFFDTNPVGRILNRFSKDTGFLDDILIYIFCEFLQFFTRFMAIVVTAAIANYYLAVICVVLVVIFVIFRWYFLKTAREIKRLEALARSPVYSHISMTLQGLPTIRAYNRQTDLLDEFFAYQNRHTQAWYLYLVTARWFGMRVDFICSIFIALVAFVSISLSGNLDAGLVGLALTYSISLTGIFQYCVRESAEVESLMVSAERVMAYGKLQSEGELETSPPSNKPPPNWPLKGHIEINDLCYRHSPNGPLVLSDINCTIGSGEKVGIVGRTGAGKSSLVASFFRLAEPNGSIKIDGIECLDIGLHDLRPNVSIIPQDPVLFSGSIRYNLDPFNKYDDEKIWTALKQVQLYDAIQSLEGGLEALVIEGGNNFSVGQRQLFCLARALLKSNKILMLDEATANVDLQTDAIIQKVIREHFSECTVLTIAHRLDTVMDSDKMMVLRGGKLMEYGVSHELLSNSESYLLRLVEHTGPAVAEKLKKIALDVYLKKKSI